MHVGPDAALVRRFQRVLLALAAVTVLGTAAELAMLRHWNGFDQLIPWFALGALAAAIAAVALRRTAVTVRVARVVGTVAGAAGLYGTWVHVHSNYEVGPLDFRYQNTWATMSLASRWWKAASGGVGPSPPLGPAILALGGACLALSTLGSRTRAPFADRASRNQDVSAS
jgi:hypothetical protein